MKIEKLREMSGAELAAEEKRLRQELFNLKFQHVTGQLDNPIKLRDLKKELARVKTVQKEQELKAAK